jgi:hypothetical protein
VSLVLRSSFCSPGTKVYSRQSLLDRGKEVNMLETTHFAGEGATPYATVTDFRETFTHEMYSLYLLSLLLTADNDKAERCFVGAMGECVEETGVFMEWARSWARWAVVKHAIQMVMPVPEHADSLSFISLKESATSAENNPFGAILALDAFERFVFVMSILEGRSEQDCAVRLRCSRRDVMIARVLALKRVASADAAYAQAEETMQS